jgi:hypothetical protein
MNASVVVLKRVKQDVLSVLSSAIKTQGDSSYLQVFENVPSGATSSQGFVSSLLPTNKIITTGVSNDTNTEIVSGIEDGAYVVTRTIAGTQKTTTNKTTETKTNTTNSINLMGGSNGGNMGGGPPPQ